MLDIGSRSNCVEPPHPFLDPFPSFRHWALKELELATDVLPWEEWLLLFFSSSSFGTWIVRPFGRIIPHTGFQPSTLFGALAMLASSDGTTAREPLHPAGGGSADRVALPTARRLHGELATAASDGVMTGSPIPQPGGTAEERLQEALRRIGQTLPPSDPVGTPGFGTSGALQDPSHGASSMQVSPPRVPPSSSTAANGDGFYRGIEEPVGREAYHDDDERAGRKARSASVPRRHGLSEIRLSDWATGPAASVRQRVSNC